MKRIAGWIRRVLIGLALFEIVHVVAGVALVQSGQVHRWLNNTPEKRKISFESAWTVIPGLAHVRDFRMTHQGRKDQVGLVVDRATAFVNPLELLGRRIHVLGLHARGVEFRYRKRPETPEEAEARVAVVPPIEGLAYEPFDGPPGEKQRGWTVVLTGARVREVRDVWVEAFRLWGGGDVAASVTIGAGVDKLISIRRALIRHRGGEILVAGTSAAERVDLSVDGRMEPFYTKQTRGKALLTLISARVEGTGRGSVGTLLNEYFGKSGWLEFEGPRQRVTASLDVTRGQVQPGGRVEVEDAPLRVRFAGFIAEGQATARLETVVSDGDAVADADVTVAFTEYGMRREAEGPSALTGEGLFVEARSPAELVRFPPEGFDGRIELGRAEFAELTFVNDFIPDGADLVVEGGRATVQGHFETGGMDAYCRGSLEIVTTELALAAAGIEYAGDAAVTVAVPDGNLRERTFRLDGTRVALDRFAFTSPGSGEAQPNWTGQLSVTEGRLDLGEGAATDARLAIAMSDSRPLVAFLSRGKPLSGWKKKLLTIEEIAGEGDLEWKRKTLTLRHVEVRGGSLAIRARGLIGPEGAFGKALVKYGILEAGIGLKGKERTVKLLGPAGWYEKDAIPGMPPLSAAPH